MVEVLYGMHGFIWFYRKDLKVGPVAYVKDICTITEIESMLAKVRLLS